MIFRGKMEYNGERIWEIKNNVWGGLKLKFNNRCIEGFVIKKMRGIKEIKIGMDWMKFNGWWMNIVGINGVIGGGVGGINVELVIVEYWRGVKWGRLLMGIGVSGMRIRGRIECLGGINFCCFFK